MAVGFFVDRDARAYGLHATSGTGSIAEGIQGSARRIARQNRFLGMHSSEPKPDELLAQRDWISQVARRMLDDAVAAEDVAQDTLVKATRSPPTIEASPDRVGILRGWLGTVMRNVIRDAKRSESRRKRREIAARLREDESSTLDVVSRADAQRRVVDAVMKLNEPYRKTILLRFFDERSPKEIADSTRVPINTVNSRLQRGLERLRLDLEGEFGGNRRAFMLWLIPLARRSSGVLGGAVAYVVAHKLWFAAGTLLTVGGTVAYTLDPFADAEVSREVVVEPRVASPHDEEKATSVFEAPEVARITESTKQDDSGPSVAWVDHVARSRVDLALPYSPTALLRAVTDEDEMITIPGMIQLPRGVVVEGFEGNEKGTERVSMKRFPGAFIDRTEVTRGQWRAFLRSDPFGSRTREALTRLDASPSDDRLPITNISYLEAERYARWAFKQVQSFAEWRYAGSAGDDRRFPWGDTLRGDLFRHDEQAPVAVASYSTSSAPFPVSDLIGNACEWTRNLGDRSSRAFGPLAWSERSRRVVGGSYYDGISNNDGEVFELRASRSAGEKRFLPEIGLRCSRALDPYPEYLLEGVTEATKSVSTWQDACANGQGVEVRDFAGDVQTAVRVFAFASVAGQSSDRILLRTNVALRSPPMGAGVFVVSKRDDGYWIRPLGGGDAPSTRISHEISASGITEPARLSLDRIAEGRVEIVFTESTLPVARITLPFYVEPTDLSGARPQVPVVDDMSPMIDAIRMRHISDLTPTQIEWMTRAYLESNPQFESNPDLRELLVRGLETQLRVTNATYVKQLDDFAKLLRVDGSRANLRSKRIIDRVFGTEIRVRFELEQAIETSPGRHPLIVDLDAAVSGDLLKPIEDCHVIALPKVPSFDSWLDLENRLRLFAAIRDTVDHYDTDEGRVFLRGKGQSSLVALELVRQHPGLFLGCILENVPGDLHVPEDAARTLSGKVVVLANDHSCQGIEGLSKFGVVVHIAPKSISELLAEKRWFAPLKGRRAYPSTFSFTTFGRSSRCAHFVEITRLESPGPGGAKLDVSVSSEDNRIEIRHEAAIQGLRIWLNDSIVDLDRPLTVSIQRGKDAPATRTYSPSRSGRVLLESMKLGACENLGAMFTAFVEIE